MLKVDQVSVHHAGQLILDRISFEVYPGDWYMVLGSNGVGKTTLVKAISGGLSYEGHIYYEERDLNQLSAKEKAQHIGVLTQHHPVAYPFTVQEVVELGRYAYRQRFFNTMTSEDRAKVEAALEITGMQDFRHKPILSLSGGELQRAFLAQVLCQDPHILILDEPANHLDLAYQEQIFATIQTWLQSDHRCVLSIVHDLSVARFYGNRGLLLGRQAMIAQGPMSEILSQDNLLKAYQIDVIQLMQNRYAMWTQSSTGRPTFRKGIVCKNTGEI